MEVGSLLNQVNSCYLISAYYCYWFKSWGAICTIDCICILLGFKWKLNGIGTMSVFVVLCVYVSNLIFSLSHCLPLEKRTKKKGTPINHSSVWFCGIGTKRVRVSAWNSATSALCDLQKAQAIRKWFREIARRMATWVPHLVLKSWSITLKECRAETVIVTHSMLALLLLPIWEFCGVLS